MYRSQTGESALDAITRSVSELAESVMYYARVHLKLKDSKDEDAFKIWSQLALFGMDQGEVNCTYSDGSIFSYELQEITPDLAEHATRLRSIDDKNQYHDAFGMLSAAWTNVHEAEAALRQERYFLAIYCVGIGRTLIARGLMYLGIETMKNETVRRNASLGGIARDENLGYAEKRREIRAIWATGKYDARVRCAEEESGALGMSISTAIKALRNTPKPASRCR